MMPSSTISHLDSWFIVRCDRKWRVQLGDFDTPEEAVDWIKTLGSSQAADQLQSYPAQRRTPNQPVAASYERSQAILNRAEDANALPECVKQPIATPVLGPVPNTFYYMPGPNGSFRSMTYDAILAELGPEKTDAIFASKRLDTQPSNPLPGPLTPPKLSRFGAIFRSLGLRT